MQYFIKQVEKYTSDYNAKELPHLML